MKDPEYVRIKISNIPKEFINKYDLQGKDQDDWIYIKIHRSCYGLTQSIILANNLF